MRLLLILWTLSVGLSALTSGDQHSSSVEYLPKEVARRYKPQVEETLALAYERIASRRNQLQDEMSQLNRSKTQLESRTMASTDYDNNEPQKKHEAQKLIRVSSAAASEASVASVAAVAAVADEQEQEEEDRQRNDATKVTLNRERRSPPDEFPPNTIQALVGQRLIVPCSNLTGLLQQQQTTDQLSRPTASSSNQVAQQQQQQQQQQHSSGSSAGRRQPGGFQRSRQPAASSSSNMATSARQPANGQAAAAAAGISLIVWHKDDPQLSSPIFTIDARGSGGALREARQQTGADWLRGRAHFEESTSSNRATESGPLIGQTPALVIDEARQLDAGLYTCAIEFHKAPTQIYQIRVNLIDPPRDMVLREPEALGGAPLTGAPLIGPYDEDSRLGLVCELESGKPTSQVSWWQLSSVASIPAGSSKSIQQQQQQPATLTTNSLSNVDYLTTMSVDSTQGAEQNLFVGMHSSPFQSSTDYALLLPLIVSGNGNHKLKHWTRVKDVSLSIGDKMLQATLQLSPLTRAYQGAEFLCMANNNQLASPLNSSVTLGMNLKPNEVRIMDKSRHVFKLGEKIMIECQVLGSRPRAQIRWLKDKLQLEQHSDNEHSAAAAAADTSSDNNGYLISDINTSTANNFTQISYLTMVPQLSDNMKSLSCVATNPSMQANPVEPPLSDSIIMNVQYPPQLRLQLGSGIRPEMIKVGGDVFMECNIESNPQIDDLTWYFNDKPVYANVSAGLIISNQSLVLQRIRVEHRGKYQCAAQNMIGRSISNKFDFRPKFEPICDYSLTKVRYEAAINQQIRVACNVLAEPNDDIHFVWKFNQSSRSALDLPDQSGAELGNEANSNWLEDVKQYETNFTSSYATFSVRNRRQYGQLLCYASNSMGRQSKPCVVWLVAPELPEPVFSCFFDGITNSSFSVFCQAPVDNNPAGGRPSYLLELQPSEANNSSAAALAAQQSTSMTHHHHLKQQRQENRGAPEDTGRDTADETTSFDEQSDSTGDEDDSPDKSQPQRQQQSANVRRERSDSPSFHVTDLSAGTHYTASIYVQNSKGRSRPVLYPVSTLGDNLEAASGGGGGRVQFINKRLPSTSTSSSGSANGPESTSLAARLISYLRVDDYLSRSVNNYYNGTVGESRPLVTAVGIVLLGSCSLIVVAFFLARLCRAGGGGRPQSLPAPGSNCRQLTTGPTTKRRKNRIWSSNNSLGTKLSTYGGPAKGAQTQPIQLTPAHSSSCSSSNAAAGGQLKALAANGSASDTSRETNTDSTTLISSNNNCQMMESRAETTALVSTAKIAAAVRSSRESLYGGGAKSPIMMMMRPSQSATILAPPEQQQRKCAGLYSTITRQQQQQQRQQQQHHNCSPSLLVRQAAHSETPQMSIKSDSTNNSQTTTTTTTNAADLLMQVNHSDNHQELHRAPSEHGSCSASAATGGGGGGAYGTEPLYVIRSSASSGSSNFVPPSCSQRMVANQNCLNSPLVPPEQQSIRLVGSKGSASGQHNFALASWAHYPTDNRSGNGACIEEEEGGGGPDETQVDLTTAKLAGYGNGNANACNHHSLAGREFSLLEPPTFLPSSTSIPVSLSECQHLHLPANTALDHHHHNHHHHRQRRHSQELQPSDIRGYNNAGSYLTLAPAGLLASDLSRSNYHQQVEYQPSPGGQHQFAYAANEQQQQQRQTFINDLSRSYITYVAAAEAEHHLCEAGPSFDHEHHHSCLASQTLDDSLRQSWRGGIEAPIGVRRQGSFDRGSMRQHSRQGQRVKFDDQQNNADDHCDSVVAPPIESHYQGGGHV